MDTTLLEGQGRHDLGYDMMAKDEDEDTSGVYLFRITVYAESVSSMEYWSEKSAVPASIVMNVSTNGM